jgi:hypothetical protein
VVLRLDRPFGHTSAIKKLIRDDLPTTAGARSITVGQSAANVS